MIKRLIKLSIYRTIIIVVLISTLLSACGGGGGDGAGPAGSSNWDELQWDQDNWV